MTATRTVVIGLDSMDLRLVERWCASGDLPNLAALLATSPTVSLSTPSRVLQGCVWPCLLTGAGPGRHGLYLYTQLQNGSYRLVDVYSDHSTLPRFYEHLGDAGVRCGIADIPGDHPCADINGMQVVDWATEFRYWRYSTVPRALARELKKRFGPNPMTNHRSSGNSQPEHRALSRKLEISIAKKAALGRFLLQRQDLDLVFFVFGEAHKAGHWLWKYHDPTHPEHKRCDAELQDAVFNIYRLLDRCVGDLMSLLTDQDNLIVFSDHGIQAAHRGDHLIDPILEKLGLLVYQDPSAAAPGAAGTRQKSAARRVYMAGKAALRRSLPPHLVAELRRNGDSFPHVSWSQTRAFSLPTDRNSYIRINLRGREPAGTVAPEDYDAVVEGLERELRRLTNPATGKPAVEEVFRIRDVFPGDRQNDLPDVAVLWSVDAPIDAVTSPAVGTVSGPIRDLRSGNHREEGFLVARGPAFVEGPSRLHGDVMQLAPTLLHVHGVPIPDQYEMGPLLEILSPALGVSAG